ncbi:DUF1654 domain-containing protein [Halomonas elongata]|uniref:DUF1654 domain-containing protein n=1 Tax=Halomonas elongata TaxID=2746 RepID=UPI003350DC2F
MAKKGKKQQAPQPPSSYELLGMRIQRQINAPAAQSEKTVVIARQDDEREEDWERLLGELETVEELTMIPLDDGQIHLRWNPEEATG